MTLKLGIIKEGKNPPDKRVPFTPEQCLKIKDTFPGVEVFVQSSNVRCFTDEQYSICGINVVNDVSHCDVLMGIKEVPVADLIPNKTYFFFSHTIKEQPHNQKLMRALLEKNIRMVDYETITSSAGGRIIGFGRYAGIVGTYNAFRLYGERSGLFKLKPAHACYDRKELEEELKKVVLPETYKIVVTGAGRVGSGCLEILNTMGLHHVSPTDFLKRVYTEPVFTQLHVGDYNKTKSGELFIADEFYNDPTEFDSDFMKYARVANMYIPCHFWDNRSPQILTAEQIADPSFKLDIIADISCDITEPIASTIRATTIDEPFFGYDKTTGKEVSHLDKKAVGVMAVDNLPCELPRDSSKDFGKVLIDKILPVLTGNDPDEIIERATICKNGKLTNRFSYLQDYASGKISV
ncbi:MAG TPA: NAD(P)-dependent oxidoreductase [Flavobacteriales bacterium]|nr:NAD(P)-dependent oxidoreductase [Flavobacteriales bacterium]